LAKRRRGVRWTRLLPVLALPLLLLLVALLLVGTCGGDDEQDAESSEPAERSVPAAGGSVEAAIGEEADLAGVGVLTTALVETTRPALPDSTVQGGPTPGPGSGNYYQAMLLIRNTSPVPVRMDPQEFTLEAEGTVLYIDPRRSGPTSRTLLPGASLDVILTFPGPTGLEPSLVYRPAWFRGTLTVKPAGQAHGQPAVRARA
jgi:hypothetical protein